MHYGWWLVIGMVVTFMIMALSPHKDLDCKKWSSGGSVRGKVMVCVEFGDGTKSAPLQ